VIQPREAVGNGAWSCRLTIAADATAALQRLTGSTLLAGTPEGAHQRIVVEGAMEALMRPRQFPQDAKLKLLSAYRLGSLILLFHCILSKG
jgi:hypothetical protein